MICEKCNSNIFEDFEVKGAKFKICTKCGLAIQTQQSEEYDKYCIEQQVQRKQKSNDAIIPRCPICQSTDLSKISMAKKNYKNSRVWHIWNGRQRKNVEMQ